MSDPVTNIEIEDVLSSIRRLVSEDTRPKFDRQALEKNDENLDHSPIEKPADALVLTPALRVAHFVEPANTGAEIVEDEAEIQAESVVSHDDENASSMDDNTDVAEEHLQDWPPHDSNDDSIDVADADNSVDDRDWDKAEDGSDTAAEGENPETDTMVENDGVASEGSYDHLSLETRIAEVEDAVADQDDQWEPDGEGEGDNAAAPVETLQWEDHIDPATDDQTEGYGEDQNQDEWQEHDEDERDETHLDEVVPQSADTQDAFLETASEAEDIDAEAAEGDAPENTAQVNPEYNAPDLDLFGADDTILDEDMLREMVSEIVRQELQGALGERITRNVRKLVRREIHRALASQELD